MLLTSLGFLMSGFEFILLFILAVIPFGLMVLSIADLLKRNMPGSDKLFWAIIIIFIGLIGPLLYLYVGRRKYQEQLGT